MNKNGDWTVIRISGLTVALCGLGMFGIPQVQAEQLNRAEADALKHLIQPKFAVAETIESAEFAAEHCPGLHVSEDGVLAEAAAPYEADASEAAEERHRPSSSLS